MGLIQLSRPWTEQPQEAGALRSDLRNYLSAVILGNSPVFDGCGPVTIAGGIARNPTQQGLAWIGDATDNAAWATPIVDGSITAGVDALFTLVCVFRKIGTAIDSNTIAGYGSSVGSSGNTIFRLIGGAVATTVRMQFQTGGGTVIYNTDSSAAEINDGKFHCVIVTAPFTSGTDTLRYYIDGKTAGTVSRAIGLSSTTFDRVSVVGAIRGGAAISFGGYEVAAFIALRGVIMPDAWCLEASTLLNVWGAVFSPSATRIWTPAASSGLPTLSSATYAPGSLTAVGFRPRVTATY